MSSGAGRRPERVGERIRSELMALLLRGAVRDPGAQNCCITDVRMTDDLRIAKVYVRLLQDADEHAQKRTLEALERAAPFLRRELAPTLKLKYHPELRFYWDDGIDRASRIESLLSEIGRDEGKGV
jgi:ribosome-binding factor A